MKIELVVNKDLSGKKIKDCLWQLGYSQNQIKKLKTKLGKICVNGKSVTAVFKVFNGDKVVLDFEEKQNKNIPLINESLTILYEDEFLLAVEKPPFVATIPSHNKKHLAGMVLNYLGNGTSFMPINRLDTNTSGIVLVAKTPLTQHFLKGKICKKYIAVINGNLPLKKFEINKKIAISERGQSVRKVCEETGKNATTIIVPKQNFKNFCIVEAQLITGRTHQIRVHLESIGHGILGDELYNSKSSLINRQALHAHYVDFVHPFTNKKIKITSPLPPDILSIINEK